MNLIAKELKGNEITLDGVDEDTRISDIKKQIEIKLNIPGKTIISYFSCISRSYY